MQNWSPQLNWKATTLFMATDPDWKRKIFVGGLVLLIPIIGWPAILGYRKVVVERLVDGALPLLPEWRGNFGKFVLQGLQAMGVIFAYFTPVILWFVFRAVPSPVAKEVAWGWIAGGILCFPIFSPLAIPLLVTYLVWFVPEPFVSPGEAVAMMAVYTFITFMIPAGFLRVSRQRRITAAFHLPDNVRLVVTSFRRYCEAWVGSGCISLLGHLAIPVSPWGVVWCYLGIVYAFNEVPYGRGEDNYLADSWIAQIDAGFLERYQAQKNRLVTRYRSEITDPAVSSEFTSLRILCFEIPIG